MAYIVRPYHRFPAACPVTYERLFEDGVGTVWNISPTGLRVSGTLPLQVGNVCSLKVTLPTHTHVSVLAGIVRWVRGEHFGIETLLMEKKAQRRLDAYIRDRMKEL